MIVGRKVRLRPVGTCASDHEQIVAWRNDPDIGRWFFSAGRISLGSHLAWHARAADDPGQAYFAIDALLQPDSGAALSAPLLIGTVGLADIDAAAGEAEFGRLMIGPPRFRGGGYAKEAAYLVVDHAVRCRGMKVLRAEVLASNATALGLYAGLGFAREAVRAGELTKDGAPIEAVRLRLTAEILRANDPGLREQLGLPGHIPD
jgi:RimJ/RimL family protein N-acetyltransferase